jgi:hypothetical protein
MFFSCSLHRYIPPISKRLAILEFGKLCIFLISFSTSISPTPQSEGVYGKYLDENFV